MKWSVKRALEDGIMTYEVCWPAAVGTMSPSSGIVNLRARLDSARACRLPNLHECINVNVHPYVAGGRACRARLLANNCMFTLGIQSSDTPYNCLCSRSCWCTLVYMIDCRVEFNVHHCVGNSARYQPVAYIINIGRATKCE